MGQFDLPILVGQKPCLGALKDAEFATLEAGGVLATDEAAAAGLDPGHAYRLVVEEGVEKTDCVATAADAGNQEVGKAFLALEDLLAGLVADDPVKITHDHRVGMGAQG